MVSSEKFTAGKDGANAPEVVDSPNYTHYPEVDAAAQSPQIASQKALPKYDQWNPSHQYASAPIAMSYPTSSMPQAMHSQSQDWPPTPPPKESAKVTGEDARTCGLRRRNAIILAVVVIVAVLAIAIGLGVGIGVGNKHNSSPSGTDASNDTANTNGTDSSNSTQAPNFTPGPSQTVSDVNCSVVQNRSIAVATSNSTSRYQILCAVHWPTGSDSFDGNGSVQDVGSKDLVAYTFEQCLGFCDDYNKSLNTTVDPRVPGSGCLAATFNGAYQQSLDKFERNCFLKDRQGVYDSAMQTTESGVLVSV